MTDFERNAIVQIHPDGSQETVADSFAGHPFEGPNDLAFDPQGNLYFTAPNRSGRDHPTGAVYRIAHGTRTVTITATGEDRMRTQFRAVVRIDTPQEVAYYRHGGILQYVLRDLLSQSDS